jgi:hypothetical protein
MSETGARGIPSSGIVQPGNLQKEWNNSKVRALFDQNQPVGQLSALNS